MCVMCVCVGRVCGSGQAAHMNQRLFRPLRQTCRSEAHIVKHQCLTSKGAMPTKRKLIQVIGLGEKYTKEAKPSVSTANSDLLDSVFRETESS